ncbi:potassium channel family protein [Bradyrhizobium sp. UNPF46]|uniref:potassium channel family protein n=1 Tax=Bradyrhizobium sp. UNPF46 TaxID=1141168 RepID=UPI0015F0C5E3|nr:potassium channel family protein [Bradyrhizobium sp. UNPF46]
MSTTSVIYLVIAATYLFAALSQFREEQWAGRLAQLTYAVIFVAYVVVALLDIKDSSSLVTWFAERLRLILYVALWISATWTAISATRALYSEAVVASKSRVVAYIAWSVIAFIGGFAIAYLDLSVGNLSAFNATDVKGNKVVLDEISALYFSIVTFATVGYGDITPMSNAARVLVSAQIIGSLMYTVLVFSVLAGFIRQPPSKQ